MVSGTATKEPRGSLWASNGLTSDPSNRQILRLAEFIPLKAGLAQDVDSQDDDWKTSSFNQHHFLSISEGTCLDLIDIRPAGKSRR